MTFVKFFLAKLLSKTRWAAVGIGVVAFLQASGYHIDPMVLQALGALGLWGVRDAIDKAKS